MNEARRLIVNADDFGLSPAVNDGVIEAHEHGIVTTASLMVCQGAAGSAARYARSRTSLGVGLHIDLGEWAFTDGLWEAVYERVDLGDAADIAREVRRQIEQFTALVARPPSHLDSHQHTHWREPARAVITRIAAELDVPLRDVSGHARYCGAFYGQTTTGEPEHNLITVDALTGVIRSLAAGTTELCCHPARTVDFDAAYAPERVVELQTLCDSRVREALAESGVELVTFKKAQQDGGAV